MMPYASFLQAAEVLAYDVEVLCARFGASFEQVAPSPDHAGAPERARGAVLPGAGRYGRKTCRSGFRRAPSRSRASAAPARAGTCTTPSAHRGRVLCDVVELPDGARWFSLARTVRRNAQAWGEPEAQFTIGLGCELKYASRLVYAKGMDWKLREPTPIGVNCRLCERQNCAQRAAPPILRRLAVDETTRGVSPFAFES